MQNGNLSITGDISRPNGNPLGIIVLKNNYSVSSDPSTTQGNIYVANSVANIDALIYADGALLSNDYQALRSTPLRMTGTLFTRNTIGGAVKTDGAYELP